MGLVEGFGVVEKREDVGRYTRYRSLVLESVLEYRCVCD